MTALDDRMATVALAGLPGVGPARLRRLVDLGAADVWDALVHRRPLRPDGPAVDAEQVWQHEAARIDPAERWAAHERTGVGIAFPGDPAFPGVLARDHQRPAVLFHRGDPTSSAVLRVAIVGTRRSTGYGEAVAHELGANLAAAGISVVSGLALGIDGAAHAGSLSPADGAPPVAVVANGLDSIYPRRNQELWRRVEATGVIWSEAPVGVAPERWRFPTRNRIIAALGDVLVVVESGHAGGSMHTVREADDRGRTVMAVPGSVRSATSLGPNQLLTEGCPPCRDVGDVLVALGLGRPEAPGDHESDGEGRTRPSADAARLLEAFEWAPATVDQLASRTGLDLARVSLGLSELLEAGWARANGGGFEPIGPRSPSGTRSVLRGVTDP